MAVHQLYHMKLTTARSLTLAVLTMVCNHARAALPDEEAILKKGGEEAAVVIQKAYEMLGHTETFASRAVSDGGSPTTGCWALTVIVRYDPNALAFLEDVYENVKGPETKLYAAAGLMALDPKQKVKLNPAKLSEKLRAMSVHVMSGCILMQEPFERLLTMLLKDGPKAYLYEKLPSIYRTTDVRIND